MVRMTMLPSRVILRNELMAIPEINIDPAHED
jgi:hypothetical protein